MDSTASTDLGNQPEQHFQFHNPAQSEATPAGPRGYAHALKDDDTFVVLSSNGDMNANQPGEHGLYHHGTRFVSRLVLTVMGQRPTVLHAGTCQNNVTHTNHLMLELHDDQGQHESSIVIERKICLGDGVLYESLELTSYAQHPMTCPINYQIASDFMDVFQVRGFKRQTQQPIPAVKITCDNQQWQADYTGLDGIQRVATITSSCPAKKIDKHELGFELTLEPRTPVKLELAVSCDRQNTPSCLTESSLLLEQQRRDMPTAKITTDSETYQRWINRSAADLHMLVTETPYGPTPYAGIPWFSALFGRDAIITALQTLWWYPSLAKGVLQILAATQATVTDDKRDSEPGKIIHELRDGELANTGEVPFGCYYGSVDATPLFVMLARAYVKQTDDLETIKAIWPHITAAIQWLEDYGIDPETGFLSYTPSPDGLIHQGWKDAPDAWLTKDGKIAAEPIALAEAQGYAYQAFDSAAYLADLLEKPEQAQRWQREARQMQRRFEDAFWQEDQQYYALSISSGKIQSALASSLGHVLWSGIASQERAAQSAQAMVSDDLFSGWGIRTLNQQSLAYNPTSYHNGSVWPHDTAIAAAGMARYGYTQKAAVLLEGLQQASIRLDLARLPELMCGFKRKEGLGPTPYPTACAPQAWASGAVFMLLAAALGMEVDAPQRRLIFRHPVLPKGLDTIEIRDLTIGDTQLDLTIYRHDNTVAIAPGKGGIKIMVIA